MMLLISPALLCLFLVGYFTEKDSLAVDGIGWSAYCYPRLCVSFINILVVAVMVAVGLANSGNLWRNWTSRNSHI